MRMRKKKNLEPRMEVCAALWIKDPQEYKGNWSSLKPDRKLVRLELGCGKGRFTAETAAAHPEDLYIAVERVPDAMVIAMERCRNMGLTNVFFIDGDAAALSDYFAPDEVDLIYINFCDPWPSVKHSRRRLTAEGFLRGYRQVLRDGGQIHFKTDNHDLFEWSLFQFPKAGFELSEVTRNLHENGICGIMTDYEEKFHSLGTPINRCVGTKTELPDVPVMEGLARRLPDWELRPVAEEELEAILELLKTAPDYFAIDGREPTEDSLRYDLANLPPRCVPSQKHYAAFWRDGRPELVLDLVEGYPRERTLFIGFFLVRGELQRRGLGRAVISAVMDAAAWAGFDQVRLGCLKGNEGGHAFWEAMGFADLREGTLDGVNSVWIMERLTDGNEWAQTRPGGGSMDVREKELYAVLEEAEHRIQENPDADQVIVVKTSKANVYHFANYQVQAGNREDEIRFINLLREQDDKEILYLAAMWNNGEVDLPSHHFRSLIMELSPRNGEAVMPLRGEVGYLVRTVGATMS